VIGPQDANALAMIKVEAEAAGAPLFCHGEDWTAWSERGRLVYQDADGLLDLPPPRLPGEHQIANAGLAVACLRRAGLKLPQQAIEAGLHAVEWPARLQRLKAGPLVKAAPEGAEIWLDGGHNPAAGAALASTMAGFEERVPRPLVLVAGMLTTKDPAGFFSPFEGLARHVLTVPVPGTEAGFAPEELARIAMAADLPAKPMPDVRSAFMSLRGIPGAPPRILICGSLYLAGAVLAENGPLPE
jgi:dihydrofolate synthase/folylpolyglutamate synthase